MKNVNQNKTVNVKLTNHFIKDLSYENLQNISPYNNSSNNLKVNDNLKVNFDLYKKNLFSLVLKYNFHCSTKQDNKNLCHLELDYVGFFEILSRSEIDQKSLTQHGLKLLFPFANEILEYITHKGGTVPISLRNVDLSLNKN